MGGATLLGTCLKAPADYAVDDVARFDERRLGQLVHDSGPDAAGVYEPGGSHDREMLARVRQHAAKFVRQLPDRALAVPQHVQDHQTLRVREHATDLGMKPVSLWVSEGPVFHWLPHLSGGRPPLRYDTFSCVVAQVAEYWSDVEPVEAHVGLAQTATGELAAT
jgi:hypothetical protein